MKQSKLMSWVETCLNTGIGFAIAIATQLLVFPLFGYDPPLSTNFKIALIFTVVSIVRGYALRRLFEALHIRVPMSSFATAVLRERLRQKTDEGWDDAHDDAHSVGELEQAGAAYALGERVIYCERWQDGKDVEVTGRLIFPWNIDWWKPQDYRHNLVRSAALLLAAGEKLDRSRKQKRRSF